MDDALVGLATIVIAGIGAQWLGRRLTIPSIILLLPAGILAGPVTGLVEPEELFGDALFPGVTLAVSLLLFESGLGLRFSEIKEGGTPVARLVTIGIAITFGLGALATNVIFPIRTDLAMMVGAILVVSGPTVIGPLVESSRPRQPVRSVIVWEGTFADPIGATLGVVTLNIILTGHRPALHAVWGVLSTVGLGVGVGLAAAALLVLVLRLYLVTDVLEPAVALLFAVAAFAAAELVLPEAGLFSTTTLGIALANQRLAPITGIRVFGTSLEILIIGSLFIILGAGVDGGALVDVLPRAAVLVAVLSVVVRPVAVVLSTWGTSIPRNQRALLACVAPRGIVAAATVSVFAIQLESDGFDPGDVVPIVFAVILGTGLVYGTLTPLASRWLGVSEARRTGVALVGSEPWMIEIARELRRLEVPVLLVAAGRPDLAGRDDLDFPVYTDPLRADVLDEALVEHSIGQAVVASHDEDHNLRAMAAGVQLLGRGSTYHLPSGDPTLTSEARALLNVSRRPFSPGLTVRAIEARLAEGAVIRTVEPLTSDSITPLVRIRPDRPVDLRPGRRRPHLDDRIIALVRVGPTHESAAETGSSSDS